MTLASSSSPQGDLAADILLATSESFILQAPRNPSSDVPNTFFDRSDTLAQRLSNPRAKLQRIYSGREEQEEGRQEREREREREHQHEHEHDDHLPSSRLRLAPSVLDLHAPGGSSRSPTPVQVIRADGSATPITSATPWSSASLSSPWSSEATTHGMESVASPGLLAARALLALPRPGRVSHDGAWHNDVDIASHGTLVRDAAPPEWFAHSFPELDRLQVDRADEPQMDETQVGSSSRQDSTSPRTDETQAGSSARQNSSAPQVRLAQATDSPFVPTLRSAAAAPVAPQLSRTTSSTVRLYGNARAARSATGDVTRENIDDRDDDDDHVSWVMSEDDVGDGSNASSLASLAPTSTRTQGDASSLASSAPTGTRSHSEESHHRARGRCFARDVHVAGWRTVGSRARGHVIYKVRIETHAGTSLTIFRRFSAFVALRSQLIEALPQHAQALPSLPSRGSGILHKYGAQHLEERRVGLQHWLTAVLLDSMWGNVEAAREWCI
ncbi:hypothetical protein IE81DRAFT_325961, partial [Ceraceosorus guamensis]